MAFSLAWKNSRSQWRLLRSVSSGVPLFPWRTAGSCLDPEMKAYLEENTEVTSSGSLTPEIQLRLLTPRCKFWWERADLWPYSDPYWAIYWPGGQALSRYVSLNVNLYSCWRRPFLLSAPPPPPFHFFSDPITLQQTQKIPGACADPSLCMVWIAILLIKLEDLSCGKTKSPPKHRPVVIHDVVCILVILALGSWTRRVESLKLSCDT